jgi:hypothetical protein
MEKRPGLQGEDRKFGLFAREMEKAVAETCSLFCMTVSRMPVGVPVI